MSTLVIDKDLIKLRGLVRWASVPPSEPRKPHEKAFNPKEPDNCFWQIEVECTDEQLEEILAEIGEKPGNQFAKRLRGYEEDVVNKTTGDIMCSKTSKKFLCVKKTKIKGEYDFGSIDVYDRKGEHLRDSGIGNDSEAIVHISIEPIRKGSASKTLRLKGVQVVNLIPFNLSKKEGITPDLLEEEDEVSQESYSDDNNDDEMELPF